MKKKNNQEKIFEILAEGGSITAFRSFIGYDKQNNAEYIFHYQTSEMNVDTNGNEYGESNISKPKITNFKMFWKNTLKHFPNLYSLYLDFIHNDYKLDLILDFRKKILSNKININELYSKNSWLDNLELNEYELTDYSPFDYQNFIKTLSKYVENSGVIMEQNGWNRIDLQHSKFKTIEDYKKYLLSNNTKNCDGFFNDIENSGVYSYFIGNKCIYIGKAKKIKNRLIDHFKSSQGFIKKSNPNDGKRHREMFGYYQNENLSIYYLEVDDKYKSQTGELLRKTFEGMMQLEYKPEFDEKNNYTQQFV